MHTYTLEENASGNNCGYLHSWPYISCYSLGSTHQSCINRKRCLEKPVDEYQHRILMPEFTNHQSWKRLTELVSSLEACPVTASTALPKSFKWQVDLQEEKISPLTQCFLILVLKFLLNSIGLNVHGGSQGLNSPFSSDKLCTKKLEKISLTVHKHTSTTSQNCTNSPYTHSVLWFWTLVTFNSCQRKK